MNVILSELKCCPFKVEISRRCGKNEAKINMDNMAVLIYKNIPIVSILNLKNILDNRAANKRSNEVPSFGLEFI